MVVVEIILLIFLILILKKYMDYWDLSGYKRGFVSNVLILDGRLTLNQLVVERPLLYICVCVCVCSDDFHHIDLGFHF